MQIVIAATSPSPRRGARPVCARLRSGYAGGQRSRVTLPATEREEPQATLRALVKNTTEQAGWQRPRARMTVRKLGVKHEQSRISLAQKELWVRAPRGAAEGGEMSGKPNPLSLCFKKKKNKKIRTKRQGDSLKTAACKDDKMQPHGQSPAATKKSKNRQWRMSATTVGKKKEQSDANR